VLSVTGLKRGSEVRLLPAASHGRRRGDPSRP